MESVKRKSPDGTVWERITFEDQHGNLQTRKLVEPGDWHWCGGTGDAPDVADDSTPPHVCMIWRKAEDQTWEPPVTRVVYVENEKERSEYTPIEELIQQAAYAEDLNRIQVLGVLYQAKALEGIARSAGLVAACMEDKWDTEDWENGRLFRLAEEHRWGIVPPNQERSAWTVYRRFDGEFGYEDELATGPTLRDALRYALRYAAPTIGSAPKQDRDRLISRTARRNPRRRFHRIPTVRHPRTFMCFHCCQGEHELCDTGHGDIECECPHERAESEMDPAGIQ